VGNSFCVRVDPYARFPTLADVNREQERLVTSVFSHDDVAVQARQHLAQYRAVHDGQDPSLMLIGDRHGSSVSLALTLTLLHDLAESGRPFRLMLEQLPASVRDFFPPDDTSRGDEFRNHLSTNTPWEGAANLDPKVRTLHIVGHYARCLGMEVLGFDPERFAAQSLEARERAMISSIRNQHLQRTIVLGGAGHIAVLYEALSPLIGTLAMVENIGPYTRAEAHVVRRMSWLLASPQVLKISGKLARLPQSPLDVVHFINDRLSRSGDRGGPA
jgi:hypothetical protein